MERNQNNQDIKDNSDAGSSMIMGVGSQRYNWNEDDDPSARKSALVRTPPDIRKVPISDGYDLRNITRTRAGSLSDNTVEIDQNFDRSQNELYKALKKTEAENKALSNVIRSLNEQIQAMSQEMKALKKELKQNTDPETSVIEYFTDEEELARETEWIRERSKSKKRKKMNRSFTPPQRLDSEQQQRQQKQPELPIKKVPKPPPIMIYQVEDYEYVYKFLNRKLENCYKVTLMNNGILKMNVDTEEHYRVATEMLNEAKFNWSSYENKQTRPIRVVAKKLHKTCKPEQIVQELNHRGYKIINAVNILKWKTKEPLPVFMLTFDNSENINKIYEITHIRGMKVDIVPLRKSKLLPQCKNCQAWGHTRKYCFKSPRCVKCAGQHLTVECKKLAGQKPKCYNCGEPHPANYRGCSVAQELQAIRNKSIQAKNPLQGKQQSNSKIGMRDEIIAKHSAVSSLTYADKVKNKSTQAKIEKDTDELEEKSVNLSKEGATAVAKQLQLILEKLNKQEEINESIINRLDRLEDAMIKRVASKRCDGK